MSTVPQMTAGQDGLADHSRLSANWPRSVLRASESRLDLSFGKFARSFSTSFVVWSTTVRRLTTYTSRRGILSGCCVSAINQMATTDVLPRPVGMLQDDGMLSGRPETNRLYNSHCQGKGRLPDSAANGASNSFSFMSDLAYSHTTTTTSFASCDSVGRPSASIWFTHLPHKGMNSTWSSSKWMRSYNRLRRRTKSVADKRHKNTEYCLRTPKSWHAVATLRRRLGSLMS